MSQLPSVRAEGDAIRNAGAVIASAAKQSRLPCGFWIAWSLALLAMTGEESRHCERSEAIQAAVRFLDCFVACAPRNDGLASSLMLLAMIDGNAQ